MPAVRTSTKACALDGKQDSGKRIVNTPTTFRMSCSDGTRVQCLYQAARERCSVLQVSLKKARQAGALIIKGVHTIQVSFDSTTASLISRYITEGEYTESPSADPRDQVRVTECMNMHKAVLGAAQELKMLHLADLAGDRFDFCLKNTMEDNKLWQSRGMFAVGDNDDYVRTKDISAPIIRIRSGSPHRYMCPDEKKICLKWLERCNPARIVEATRTEELMPTFDSVETWCYKTHTAICLEQEGTVTSIPS